MSIDFLSVFSPENIFISARSDPEQSGPGNIRLYPDNAAGFSGSLFSKPPECVIIIKV